METARHIYTASAVFAVVLVGSLIVVSVADAAINSSRIRITIDNSGTLMSDTRSTSNTGDNVALGSLGGDGGDGGNVGTTGGGNNNNGNATAGDGGDGGNGSDGGSIATGNATSLASSTSTLNDTEGNVTVTPPTNVNSSNIIGDVTNTGPLKNTTRARGVTGTNVALGSAGGAGDDGGEVTASGSGNNNNGGVTGGEGGEGGSAGFGGTIVTGAASNTTNATSIKNRVRFSVSL